jgi:crotonobetainyl-CoA:carnitine CoA-transferase CaiB-like acyl-CoA transferase
MANLLDGVRVLELTQWGFVPSTGVILAEWGATVVKIEHPEHGDPMRGLVTSGLVQGGRTTSVNYMWELANRGKQGIAVDLSLEEGRSVLYRLVETADVFITSFLPAARRKLRVDVEDLRAVKPDLIYARGHGQGTRGAEAEKGGFDSAMYWARSGLSMATTRDGASTPMPSPGPAHGDFAAGLALAGAIAAALFHRDRHHEAVVVDVSLLAMGLWVMAPAITASGIYGPAPLPQLAPPPARTPVANPLSSMFRTADDRFVALAFLQADRYWPQFCELIGRSELIADPRFVDADARAEHSVECLEILDAEFAQRPLDEWRGILAACDGVWAPVQVPIELRADGQVVANGYLADLVSSSGEVISVAAGPAQFDEQLPTAARAPEFGEHTDPVLLDAGYSWDELIELKTKGAVL